MGQRNINSYGRTECLLDWIAGEPGLEQRYIDRQRNGALLGPALTQSEYCRHEIAELKGSQVRLQNTNCSKCGGFCVVDIPEALAVLLREFVAGKSGYLFPTKKGNRALAQRNVLRVLHDTGVKVGFHAFRRCRAQVLRRARVPEDLVGLWLGHARRTVTDVYAAGLQNDLAWRSEWAEKAGWAS